MGSTDLCKAPDLSHWHKQPLWHRWATRPLCTRYSLLLIAPFNLGRLEKGSRVQVSWRWGYGMLADGEGEAVGAWPATAEQDRLLRESLRQRGVERIAALLGEETLAHAMDVPVATLPLKASTLAALAAVARLHAKIERAVSREAPFPDEASAAACIASVLQKAELSELAAQRRRLEGQWRAQTRALRAAASNVPRG